jgi:hypothetical protein
VRYPHKRERRDKGAAEAMAGKFSSDRDEFLYSLTLDGTERTSGDVQAPTGFYSIIIVAETDVAALHDAHPYAGDAAITAGNYLLVEDGDGFVTVTDYPTAADAESAFEDLENRYAAWSSS